MHARIGVLRALNRNVVRLFNSDRKDTHWESGNKRDLEGGSKPLARRLLEEIA
jgi:hypothetical protein